jgi:hypothetical protein
VACRTKNIASTLRIIGDQRVAVVHTRTVPFFFPRARQLNSFATARNNLAGYKKIWRFSYASYAQEKKRNKETKKEKSRKKKLSPFRNVNRFTPEIAGAIENPLRGFDDAGMTVDLKIPEAQVYNSNNPRFEDLYKYPRERERGPEV